LIIPCFAGKPIKYDGFAETVSRRFHRKRHTPVKNDTSPSKDDALQTHPPQRTGIQKSEFSGLLRRSQLYQNETARKNTLKP